MERLIAMYESAYRAHGDTPAAVLWPKGRQEERFHALTRHIQPASGFSLLDYGCGLAHLKPFLDARHSSVAYTGADAVPAFIDANRASHPDASFFLAQSPDQVPGRFDYIVACGAFNIRYGESESAHRDRVFDILATLYDKASVYLAVDFMTDAVDYRQPDAYHQNVEELYRFVTGRLSRRIVLDQSYMPFEYALTIWKSQAMTRPDHRYERPAR